MPKGANIVPSSVISRFAYDPGNRTLDIRFFNGKRYRYLDVQPGIAEGLAAAPSKGRYFNEHVRNRFRFERIGASEPAN